MMTQHPHRHHRARWAPILILGLAFALAGCGGIGAEATPIPTRTPLPTFTPTPPDAPAAVDPNAGAQEQPAQPQDQTQPQPDQPQAPVEQQPAQPAAAPTDTPAPPTNTPAPAEVTTNDVVNIRQGPGTTYGLAGSAQSGEKFRVTGKSPDAAWWQIDYNGTAGWIFGQLVTTSNTEAVAVAQNIPEAPAAPPTQPPAPPTDTPVPAPAAPVNTPAPPKPQYKFNVAVVSSCVRQPAGNWFEGKTYINGQPQSGYKVVFSSGPDGAPATPPVISGPHAGYEGWSTGFYSHIINASGPQAGNWFVWVVDDNGARISEIGNFQTTGPGEGCNQAIVDFDSR